MVLRLSQQSRRLRRSSVVSFTSDTWDEICGALQAVSGQPPCQILTAALEVVGL